MKPILISFCNDIAIGDDGWAQIAPFGDHPSLALIPDAAGKIKKQKAIQRIDKPGAEAMVAGFHNERRGLRKFLRGCNIYVGHPDVPGLEKFYPDKEPKGVFADMQVRADGLYGLPVFTNEGSNLVEQKTYRAFSGNIGESEECEAVNGTPCYRPTKIFSAGLTNSPHLPVHFFNSDDTLADPAVNQNQNQTMKKKIIALCATLGVQFANEADDAQTEAALDQVQTKVAAFANEKATLESSLTAKDGELATLKTEKDTAVTERDTARTQFANERKARIEDALSLALTSGRITAAERGVWEGRLKVEAQFVNELDALTKLAPKVKTTSVTVNRGGKEQAIDISQPGQRAKFVNEVLTEVAAELKLDPVKHYDRIYREVVTRHPALFANMAQPEIKHRAARNGN